jgi:hypothetical protein
MNLTDATTTQISIVVALAVIAVIGILAWFFNRKRRTERLRTQFGSAEYARRSERRRRPTESGSGIGRAS